MFTNRAPRDTFALIAVTITEEIIVAGPFGSKDDAHEYAWLEGTREYKIIRDRDSVVEYDSQWRKAA